MFSGTVYQVRWQTNISSPRGTLQNYVELVMNTDRSSSEGLISSTIYYQDELNTHIQMQGESNPVQIAYYNLALCFFI